MSGGLPARTAAEVRRLGGGSATAMAIAAVRRRDAGKGERYLHDTGRARQPSQIAQSRRGALIPPV